MRRAAAVAAVLVLASTGGCGVGETTATETETTTVTEATTVTVTRTETVAAGLPGPVDDKRREIVEAAERGDYEAVAALAGDDFSYTFGAPVAGGPAAYWRDLAESTDEEPLPLLADLLRLPPTLERGVYVWPFAFDAQADELTAHERELLSAVGGADLSDDFAPGAGYVGWRAGIEPRGEWIFFVAGD